jgi:hypothetical protein
LINWRQIFGYRIQDEWVGWLVRSPGGRYAVIVINDHGMLWGSFAGDETGAIIRYEFLKDHPESRERARNGGELYYVNTDATKIRYIEPVPFEVNLEE